GTLLIARKPIAPGANGWRNSAAAWAWVRAGSSRLPFVSCMVNLLWLLFADGASWSSARLGRPHRPGGTRPRSGRELSGGVAGEAGLVQKARGTSRRAPAAFGGMRDQQPILGTCCRDVEQAALLLKPPRIGRCQRAPRGQQLLLAGQQHDERSL